MKGGERERKRENMGRNFGRYIYLSPIIAKSELENLTDKKILISVDFKGCN